MRKRRRRMRKRRRRRRPHPPMSMTRGERSVVDTTNLGPTFDEARSLLRHPDSENLGERC